MFYLIASLLMLILTPFFSPALPEVGTKLRMLGSVLLVMIGFGLALHVFFEHHSDLILYEIILFLSGFGLLRASEAQFFQSTRKISFGAFLCIILFTSLHAVADGFALTQRVETSFLTLGSLQAGVLIHRFAFEALLWGFVKERYDNRKACIVLAAIFIGTIFGFGLGRSLIETRPQIFDLFEYFMAGAFFHIGIDALREIVRPMRSRKSKLSLVSTTRALLADEAVVEGAGVRSVRGATEDALGNAQTLALL